MYVTFNQKKTQMQTQMSFIPHLLQLQENSQGKIYNVSY